MKSALKWIIGILLIVVLANGYRRLSDWSWKENLSPNHKADVIDGLIGRTALDQYQDMKKKKDSFNLPAYKAGVTMFTTGHSRYPRSMDELVESGELSPELARDQYGSPFELTPQNNGVLLRSAGPDRIKGSTDDVEFRISL